MAKSQARELPPIVETAPPDFVTVAFEARRRKVSVNAVRESVRRGRTQAVRAKIGLVLMVKRGDR